MLPSNSRFLITGGAGFIGSHLAATLLARGHRVRVLDNFATGRRENLAAIGGPVELIEGSVADEDACRRACDGVDYVLHQAAIPSVPRSVREPVPSHVTNVTGTLYLLEAARAAGVKRVVYAASSSAYGDCPHERKREDIAPEPLSPYAAMKLAGEHYLRAWHSVYGLETVSLRYFNVFGPRQDPQSEYAAVIPRFIVKMMRGERPTIYGDGLQSRDFTFVENNVEANLLACTAPGAAGQVFNIACGKSYTLLDLVAAINGALGTAIDPIHEPARTGDVRHSLADIGAAERALGFRPTVSFEEGLARTIESFRGSR